MFQCRDEGPIRARVRWVRPAGRPLPPGSRDNNGRLEIPNIRVRNLKFVCNENESINVYSMTLCSKNTMASIYAKLWDIHHQRKDLKFPSF